MDYEIIDCIDAGTEFCPCHLSETGDCILCSQLQGKDFCDCTNWKGVCIYQESVWKGDLPKAERKDFLCKIYKKHYINENVIAFTILVKHKLAQELSHPGSFIFLRNPETNKFFDVPISIMDSDTEENRLKIVIELKGIKTKMLNKLNENDNIVVRGPFWNGALGLKNIYSSFDKVSLLIARGIGIAPMIPIMKRLYSKGNKIIVIIDETDFSIDYFKNYFELCNAKIIKAKLLNNGKLSTELKNLIDEYKNEIDLVYCAGPDILISNILEFIPKDIKTACCNNAKMCCGEGICGTCSVRYKGHVVKKLCKVQIDPKYIFDGRRLI
jgi:NAD(P)H-flavin reductase